MAKTRSANRASMEEIEAMPALLTTDQLARITGWTRLFATKQCRCGMFEGVAVKAGSSWQVSKAKALEMLGLA